MDYQYNQHYYQDNYQDIDRRIRDEVEREMKRRIHYERRYIEQTDEEKLNSIDIAVIEKYLRKKKLDNIKKK